MEREKVDALEEILGSIVWDYYKVALTFCLQLVLYGKPCVRSKNCVKQLGYQ